MPTFPVIMDPVLDRIWASDYNFIPNLYDIGNIRYYIGPDTNNHIAGSASDHTNRIWFSMDQGGTWNEKDPLNRKSVKYQPNQVDLDKGHAVATVYDTDNERFIITYLLQDTVANTGTIQLVTWTLQGGFYTTVINTGLQVKTENGYPNLGTGYAFDVTYRPSDGTFCIFYQGASETVSGTAYDRVYYSQYNENDATPAWTTPVMLPGQSTVAKHYNFCGSCIGLRDITHFFYKEGTAGVTNVLKHASLNSSDALSAVQTVTSTISTDSDGYWIGHPIFWRGWLYIQVLNTTTGINVCQALSTETPTWIVKDTGAAIGSDQSLLRMGLTNDACNTIYSLWTKFDGHIYQNTNANDGQGWSATSAFVTDPGAAITLGAGGPTMDQVAVVYRTADGGGGGGTTITGPYPIDPINQKAHGSDRWIEPNLYGTSTAGVRYLIAPDTNEGDPGTSADHTIRCWKSTDYGATWTEQDGSNRLSCKWEPGSTNASRNISPSIYDSSNGIIYGLYFINDPDPYNAFLYVFRFNTNTDTWMSSIAGTASQYVPANGSQFPIQEERSNPVAQPVNGLCASIARRASDGALIIFFNGPSEIILGVYYNRMYYDIYSGGSWAGVTLFPGQVGVAKDYYMWNCFTDSSDLVHFFYLHATGDLNPPPTDDCELYHNSLSLTNVVSARQVVATDTEIWLMGTSGGRAIVAGMPTSYNGKIWLPVFGPNSVGSPHNPAFRVISASAGVALPTWTFVTDVTPGGATSTFAYDLGPIHDTTNLCLVGLSGVPALYAIWTTGGGVFYKSSTDDGVTWSAVTTLVDSEISPFPYRWLLEAAAVSSTCFGIYFPQDGEFYWWPVEYMEVCFGSAPVTPYFKYFELGNPHPLVTGIRAIVKCCEFEVGIPIEDILITGTQGDSPYTYAACPGFSLPDGLTLNADGSITGTPTTVGGVVYCVRVTDDAGNTGDVYLTINIVNQHQGNIDAYIYGKDNLDMNLKMTRRDTFTFDIQVTDNNGPVPLTGGLITFTVKYRANDTDSGSNTVMQLKSTGSQVVITDAVNGLVTITILPTNTTSLAPYRVVLPYDIQFVDASSNVYTVATGFLEVSPDVTISTT